MDPLCDRRMKVGRFATVMRGERRSETQDAPPEGRRRVVKRMERPIYGFPGPCGGICAGPPWGPGPPIGPCAPFQPGPPSRGP
ncbi:hypothetical protein FJU11_11065 [Pararhizobium mangrovi]|uniref:Uncharacterized protein n=1 Tax=Pararhizobium mangrovi TaxID=2590452 RepID=A0A506U2R6_9HYPH|nr:hypothetical protein FJU11_11065 [Pararhizobium mangrovi]